MRNFVVTSLGFRTSGRVDTKRSVDNIVVGAVEGGGGGGE